MNKRSFDGYVRDAGGGVVTVVVDRETEQYPPVGAQVNVTYTDVLEEYIERVSEEALSIAYGREFPGLHLAAATELGRRDARQEMRPGDVVEAIRRVGFAP